MEVFAGHETPCRIAFRFEKRRQRIPNRVVTIDNVDCMFLACSHLNARIDVRQTDRDHQPREAAILAELCIFKDSAGAEKYG